MPRPIHFEYSAEDPERAARFYSEALGWQVDKWGGPIDYWLLTTGSGGAGIDGAFTKRDDDAWPNATLTVGVDDVDAACERVLAAGGAVLREKQAVPGVGWLAYCQDTEGNPFGMMQDDGAAGL